MMNISKEVASSVYTAIADDALKDEDNGIWLSLLPDSIQMIWRERFHWIRRVDRLAEQDQLVHPGGQQFPAFYHAWQQLKTQKYLAPEDQHWTVLQQIEAAWFLADTTGGLHQAEINAWDCYMEAIVDYHQPSLHLTTLAEYEVMLERLAGACFEVLPFLADHQRAIARQFGVVDQFYNNLRDLYEDARQGICYFPETLLENFGIKRSEILDQSCLQNPGYLPLMDFWVNTYLPELRQRHLGLLALPDLHPAWRCLTAWFVHRYLRIERVLRACQYNFVTFAQQYWHEVKQDLEERKRHLRQGRPLWPSTALVTAAEMAPLWPRLPDWDLTPATLVADLREPGSDSQGEKKVQVPGNYLLAPKQGKHCAERQKRTEGDRGAAVEQSQVERAAPHKCP
jgi:phytoene synthase